MLTGSNHPRWPRHAAYEDGRHRLASVRSWCRASLATGGAGPFVGPPDQETPKSGPTALLPFQPATMTTAQLAAVSYLVRYAGRTTPCTPTS